MESQQRDRSAEALVRRCPRETASRSLQAIPHRGMRARHEDLHPAFGKALPRCCEISMRFDRRGGRGVRRPCRWAYRNRRSRSAQVPPGATACTTGGNNYPSGINVGTTETPINVTLQPGVQVIRHSWYTSTKPWPLAPAPPRALALPATLIANNAAITITSNPGAGPTSALFLQPPSAAPPPLRHRA